MKTNPFTAAVLAFPLAFSAAAADGSKLQLSRAWVRATPPNAQVAGAFLRIENTGSTPERLLSASTDAAARVEMHEMKMSGEVMQMRPLSDGLDIPAGQGVTLAPGGTHLMLISPKHPLTEGRRVKITLVFENAGRRTLEFPVRKQAPEQAAPEPAHH